MMMAAPPESKPEGNRIWDGGGWVADQGREGSCVGHGWGHWLHCEPIRQTLDPVGIYKLAQYLDEWKGQNYSGTSVRAGAKVLHHLGLIEEYQWARSAAQVARHVLETGPVVIGVDWHQGMTTPGPDGYIRRKGPRRGGHCVCVTGYSGGDFQIKNSWGPGWGNGGYAMLSYDDMDDLLVRGSACTGTETSFTP